VVNHAGQLEPLSEAVRIFSAIIAGSFSLGSLAANHIALVVIISV